MLNVILYLKKHVFSSPIKWINCFLLKAKTASSKQNILFAKFKLFFHLIFPLPLNIFQYVNLKMDKKYIEMEACGGLWRLEPF